jgi:hypothetical protein
VEEALDEKTLDIDVEELDLPGPLYVRLDRSEKEY